MMPHINISKSEKGNNKGSSRDLAMYLEKENEQKKHAEKEKWFDQNRKDISLHEVIRGIDNNRKGLRQDDAKFYLVNVSPSKDEINTLGRNEEQIKENLKEYAKKVMDDYAKNFKLQSGKEIKSEDLKWYGKIECDRYYKGNEEEVKNGIAKIGDKKPGQNFHAQIIVSHRDREMKVSLSPLTNDRERFSLMNLKKNTEQSFDKMFAYDRTREETFGYLHAMKNASIRDKTNLRAGREIENNFLFQIKQIRSNEWQERKANVPTNEKKKHFYDLELGLQVSPKQKSSSEKKLISIDFAPYKVMTSKADMQKFNSISAALKHAEKQKNAIVYNSLKENKIIATSLDGRVMMHQEKDKSAFKQKIRPGYGL